MTDSGSNAADHALLARLNALRKSTVDLEAKQLPFQSSVSGIISIDPAPARALHTDLLSRFNTLNGQKRDRPGRNNLNSVGNDVELFSDEDGKTVEDLLAELGPEESWQVGKNEEDDVENLLKTAKATLDSQNVENSSRSLAPDEAVTAEASARGQNDLNFAVPEQPNLTEEELDREADEYVAQVLEEIKHAPEEPSEHPQDDNNADSAHENTTRVQQSIDPFPSAPLAEPDPPSYSDVTADDALASRFANLGLPSVPTVIKPPTSVAQTKPPQTKGFTDEEIDSWCIICNEDATLSCVGCDDDLYCTNCWLDGHKGPDAGPEERTHKAVQYNKGGGTKKQPARRMLGA